MQVGAPQGPKTGHFPAWRVSQWWSWFQLQLGVDEWWSTLVATWKAGALVFVTGPGKRIQVGVSIRSTFWWWQVSTYESSKTMGHACSQMNNHWLFGCLKTKENKTLTAWPNFHDSVPHNKRRSHLLLLTIIWQLSIALLTNYTIRMMCSRPVAIHFPRCNTNIMIPWLQAQ